MISTKSPRAPVRATPMHPTFLEALQWDIQQIQLSIARRAYELFEMRNREHGHDWEDWFQAESELLRPVSIAMSDATDHLSVRANVFGFSDKQLKVSLEPMRITIVGRKLLDARAAADREAMSESEPDQILRVIDLSSEIEPLHALVELQAGVLKFELPKVEQHEAMEALAMKV
jgi:HSP20 family molecular chaperone IbpA